jgi:hypothetical protein
MMSDYVPHHLGFSHIDHETFVREHNTPLAKTLFTSNEKSAVLVLDGTYIYNRMEFRSPVLSFTRRIPRQDSTDRTDELRNDDNLEDICEN